VSIAGLSFDPVLDGEPSFAGSLERAPAAGLVLVQLQGAVRDAWRQQLEAEGLEILQYYPNGCYLVWASSWPEAVARRSFVRWVGPFHPGYALGRSVAKAARGRQRLEVLVAHADRLEETLSEVTRCGADVQRSFPAQPDGRLVELVVEIDSRHVVELARVPTIIWIGAASVPPVHGGERSSAVVAGLHEGGVPQLGYRAWLDAVGFDGSGVTWSVIDTGVDHDHPDLDIVAGYSYPGCLTANPGDESLDTPLGHGTCVAGLIAADATSGLADDGGFLHGLGVAPGAALFTQNFCVETGWPPEGGWQELSRHGVLAGASGSNNSWWLREEHGYRPVTRAHDLMVRDGDFTTPEVAEPHVIVFIAGNAGPDTGTVTAQGEGKNTIVVGASEGYPVSRDIDAIPDFSGRGPAMDGRIVPTVIAPGEAVATTRNDGGGFLCLHEIDATGGLYAVFEGTSAAAPHVSGALAVLFEWWRAHHGGVDPSPAMARALLVNHAVDVAGAPPIPNPHEGWGRIDISGILNPVVPALHRDQDVVLDDTGDEETIEVRVAAPDLPLKITLAWTDAPGAVDTSPSLVNDLDLLVQTAGETYQGNWFDGGWSVPGGAADRLNTLENVFVEAPGGQATITVRVARIAADGVPVVGDSTDQDFALVCTNCRAVPPQPRRPAGRYQP
jgi:hypothetical protein